MTVLLLLAALRKGSPRADRKSLSAPLSPDVVSFNTDAYFQSNSCTPSWADASTELQKITAATLNQLYMQPELFHPLSGKEPEKSNTTWPLIVLDDHHIGFSRYWHAVKNLEDIFLPRLLQPSESLPDDNIISAALQSAFYVTSDFKYHFRQFAAAALACRNRFLIVSGGPGTGKTSVILQIIRTLLGAFKALSSDRIVICAPTGRAKARLSESLDNNVNPSFEDIFSPINRKTVHSLLGQRSDGTFKYNSENRLPFQVVIVDEASMLDIHLFSALLKALPDDARLILAGDMHQLPSVDAGAVLGDLTRRFSTDPDLATLTDVSFQWLYDMSNGITIDGSNDQSSIRFSSAEKESLAGSLADHVVILTHSYRSSQSILDLASTVNSGETEKTLQLLAAEDSRPALSFSNDPVELLVGKWFNRFFNDASVKESFAALNGMSSFSSNSSTLNLVVKSILFHSMILTFVNDSKRGRTFINTIAETSFRKTLHDSGTKRLFHGLPVIIGANHHSLDLYNGDIGIVVQTPDGLKICFPRGRQCHLVAADRLRSVEPAFALTVHKSQGSEFNNVLLVLPEKPGPYLSRQIVYTGITRAKKRVHIAGTTDVLKQAIDNRMERTGGIRIG